MCSSRLNSTPFVRICQYSESTNSAQIIFIKIVHIDILTTCTKSVQYKYNFVWGALICQNFQKDLGN